MRAIDGFASATLRLRKTNRRALSPRRPRENAMVEGPRRGGRNWLYLLLLIQFVLCLWVPLYNRVEPSVAGIPFFYWFQLLLVLIGAALTAIVYFATDE
jgi:hypothetical protein